jgi:hypothetical protein
MTPPKELHALCSHFRDNQDEFKSHSYNETRLRREFIDPFFELLGWDVQNRNRYAEAYKDVLHEDAIRINGSIKAPDYAFRIGGVRKFFLEAKKPSVNIKLDSNSAFQLRRYAWSAKLPLSILTDFEEFAVYDCRVRPSKGDSASVARVFYLTFDEYPRKWDELIGIFSREAILRGSFDKYSTDNKRKHGTTEVDDAFLEEIEFWRASLAKNIALRNADLTARQLNTVVQQIIDRIIFLRIAEDRGFEPYGQLQSLASGATAYNRLCTLFLQADSRYNSGLFHFKKSPDVRDSVDGLSLKLTIDDTVIRKIVRSIYYPDSPYEFSVIGADILGHVYEQFLGRIIDLRGKRATVSEKHEVKKAGGVYYTPTYIVQYLVNKTLGPLLSGRTLSQVAGLDKRSKTRRPVRVIDPACGSGSFLIEAYQQLLDWYLAAYVSEGAAKHARGKEPKIYQVGAGRWRLSVAERRRILLDHIYGVDIDRQAVEVTKLSLCLKVLEGETNDAIARQMDLFHTRALPDLHSNIKWGNSLVGSDVYGLLPRTIFDDDERLMAICPFDWAKEFSFLKKNGSFDAIIANPPYLPIFEMRKELLPYYNATYATYQKRFDAYALFVEAISKRLMGTKSRIGLIIPSSLLNNEAFSRTRELIAQKWVVEEIDRLGGAVFKGVNKDTLTVVASGSGSGSMVIRQFLASPSGFGGETAAPISNPQTAISATGIAVRSRHADDILEKLTPKGTVPLGEIADTYQGIVTGADDVFIGKSFSLDVTDNGLVKPFLFGSDVSQFRTPKGDYKILYVTKDTMIEDHQMVEAQLRPARSRLEKRRETANGTIPWYALHWPRRRETFEQPKILVQGIRNLKLLKRVIATIDFDGHYPGVNLCAIVPRDKRNETLLALAAILNSRVVNYWFSQTYVDHRIKNAQLETIPIPINTLGFIAAMPRIEKKVRELTFALDKVRSDADGTGSVWATRAASDREQLEELVEDAYELDLATRQAIRVAPCNASA